MIYAIILIILGLIAIVFNNKIVTRQSSRLMALITPVFIVWGVVGIIILSTIRYGVFYENTIYWVLLIVGSVTQIIIGSLYIFRYFKLNTLPKRSVFTTQTVLGIFAIIIGFATIIVKY